MKIGFNMLLWTTFVKDEHREMMELLKAAGADGVEIPLMGEGDVAHYRELGRMMDGIGLERTAAMCFLDAGHNPVSDDPKIRQAAADWLRMLIEQCAAMKAQVLCGPMFQPLGMFSGAGPTEAEKERAADVLRAVAGEAQAAGVLLAVEPVNRFECYMMNTLGDAADFAARVGHPSVGVLFDTFHANIEEKDPVGCIRQHGGAIRHFHVSANDRGTPGRDHIDWRGTFTAIKSTGYDQWMVVEAFGRALPALAAATRIWRDLFESNAAMARESLAFVREQLGQLTD